MRRVLGVLFVGGLVLGFASPSVAATGSSSGNSREVRLSTAVNEPVELAVELESRGRDSVWVEVEVREVGGAVRRGEAAAYLETGPGSGRFDRLSLEERRASRSDGMTYLVGQSRRSARGDGEIRLHLWPRVRGDYEVELSVGRDRGGRSLDAVVADLHVSSRFDQVGFVSMNTEIVDVTSDGRLLVSTGGQMADVSDPANPVLLPQVTGVPVNSVAITPDDHYALFAGFQPELAVVDLTLDQPAVVARIAVPPGADSVAVSEDGHWAALAIEADGAGGVAIVDLSGGGPQDWTVRTALFDTGHPAFGGAASLQSEYVAFGPAPGNVIAAGFQSANAIALVDPVTAQMTDAFSLGTLPDPVTGDQVRLQPDGIGWTPDGNLVTANEGDTRSWAAFSPDGQLLFDSGSELLGHLARYGLSGGDPQFEEVDAAGFPDGETLLFAGMERTSSVAVYDLAASASPRFGQLVRLDPHEDADTRPEGIKVVPDRDLVFVANEDDDTVSILRRTPDATDGVPQPLQGVQPVSPATPWTSFVEFEPLGNGSYLAAGRRYNAQQPGGLWTVVFEGDIPVVVDPLPVDVPAAELDNPYAIEIDHRRDGVWIVTDLGRAYLVGWDGAIDRTLELGPGVSQPSGALLDGRSLWVASGASLVRADVVTGDVTTYDPNAPRLRSLFRLPHGGIGLTFGDSRNGLQLRRVAPDAESPNGLLPLALVANIPPAELPWNLETFPPEAVLSDGDDAVVMWPSTQVGQTRFITYPDALEPADEHRRAKISANVPDAPLTLDAGSPFAVTVTTDRPGLAVAEIRRTGERRDDWTVAAVPDVATIDDGVAPGTSTLRWLAPPRDGDYDVRIRYVTAAGKESWSKTLTGALHVDTSSGASVAITQPTTSNPAYAATGTPFSTQIQANKGGTARLLARPSGTTTAFTPLADFDLYGNRALAATAPELDPAVTGPAAYDLRLEFRAGGDAEPITVDASAALVVIPDAPGTVTLDSPAPGTTVAAGQRVQLQVTVDQPGTLTWSLVPPDGGEPVVLTPRTFTRPGSASFFWASQGPDGAWDLAVRFTNLAGAVREQTFEDVLIVDTPDADVTMIHPTTAEPLSVPNLASISSVRFSLSSPGLAVLEARPADGGDWTPIDEQDFVVAPGTVVTLDLGWTTVPVGRHDLRVTFTNLLGETDQDVQTNAFEVTDQAPTFALLEPTTANPVVVAPGEQFRVHAAHDQVFNAQVEMLARPTGTSEPFQPLDFGGQLTSSWNPGALATAPETAGDYDVRLSYTRYDGRVFTFDESAALQVRTDRPGLVLRNPLTVQPLRVAPGVSVDIHMESRRPGTYRLQMRPAGGDWADVGETTATDEVQLRSVRLQPLDTPGSYDLRVVEVDGPGVHVQPGSLIVGPTPQAPVVIDEINNNLLAVRNVSGVEVDVSGWALVACHPNAPSAYLARAAVPAGTILASGGRLVMADPRDVDDWDVPFNGDLTLLTGAALLDSDAVLIDSVSQAAGLFSGPRCREQRAALEWSDTASVRRDAAGTDTGDNSADFVRAEAP